jgi:hypothetical protein
MSGFEIGKFGVVTVRLSVCVVTALFFGSGAFRGGNDDVGKVLR